MNGDWRELLDRLSEGETLSEADARALADALAAPPGSGEASEWLRFEAALRERLGPPDAERIALSRERLLAKALLCEKQASVARPSSSASLPKVSDSLPKVSDLREVTPRTLRPHDFTKYPPEDMKPSGGKNAAEYPPEGVRPSGGKRRRRAIALAAIAAVALLAAAVALLVGGRLFHRANEPARQAVEAYPEPVASGEFQVVSPGRSLAPREPVRRGDEFVVGSGGARLALGGYCSLAFAPESEVVVQGEPGKEEIELKAGRVVSRITPARGQFRVRTPLGCLDVVGTEFVTSVLPPSSEEGEASMGRLTKAAVVTVMVVSGTVAYHFGGSAGLLSAGMSQAFGGEEQAAPALPDCLSGFKGLLLGTITSKGEHEFVMKIDRIAAPWKESKAENPEAAVGKEARVVIPRDSKMAVHFGHALAGLNVGDQVVVEAFHFGGEQLSVIETLRKAGVPAWAAEHREGEAPHGHGDALVPREGGDRSVFKGVTGGFKSLVVGTILAKGDEDFTLKVDQVSPGPNASEAERADALSGQEVKITLRRGGTLRPRHVESYAGLKVGDRALVGITHVDGKTYAVVSVLKRVEAAPPTPRGEGEHREGDRLVPREGGDRPRSEGEHREGERLIPREGGERHEGAAAPAELLQGFRGILEGTIEEKGEDAIRLRVEKVGKVWQSNQAKNPEGIAGRSVRIVISRERPALRAALATVKAGDRIAIGAIQNEGGRLTAAELLKKLEGE